jgi:cytoskeleton protein RodZ
MSDDAAAAAGAAPSAGRLLREARERQGLHIAALAAAIKVAPKKLELLEADRFEALPDATFTRALAQTVCRALKVDPAPVLSLLPPPLGQRLEHVGTGLNAPFRERPGAGVLRDGSTLRLSPVVWLSALFLIAAVALYFAPSGLLGIPHWRGQASATAAGASQAAASAPSADASAAQTAAAPEPAESVQPSAQASPPTIATTSGPNGTATIMAPEPEPLSTAGDAAPAVPGVIQLRATAPSWIEVTDGSGRSLVARLVQPGETIDLEGAAPFRVRIGNAAATRVKFRGQPMELAAYTRDNVARLELK